MKYVVLRKVIGGLRNSLSWFEGWAAKILRKHHPREQHLLGEFMAVLLQTCFAALGSGVMWLLCLVAGIEEGILLLGALSIWTPFYLLALIKGWFRLSTLFHMFVFVSLASFFMAIQFSGGFQSPFFPWMVLPPTAGFLLLGRKGLWTWSMTTGLVLIAMGFVRHRTVGLVEENMDTISLVSALGLGSAQLLSVGLLLRTRQRLNRSRKELDEEMQQQQEQLLSIEKGRLAERERISLHLRHELEPLFDLAATLQIRYLLEVGNVEERSQLASQFNQLAEEMHRISKALYPEVQENGGLQKLIRELVRDLEKGLNIQVLLELPAGDAIPLGPSGIHVYRIVQEAFRNIVQHAYADKVFLRLESVKGAVRLLVIEDNGVGMPNLDSGHKGQGLLNISDRVSLLEGVFTIIKGREGGTRMVFKFPTPITEGMP